MIIIRRPNPSPATYTLKDEDENVLSTGSIDSGASANIEAPNGDVSVNSVAFDDVLSGGTINIEVRKSTGSDLIGSKQGQFWRIGDSSISNSDSSYDVDVKATESLILPDSRINVNSVDRGNVVSVKTIDVNLTDGTNPVTPTSVVRVGNTLTIQVPAGASPAGVAFQMPKPSQWETFRTGDTGWRARNGWYDITEPTNPKAFARLDYSAGTNGLYLLESPLIVDGVSSTRRFVDVDGGQTFSATGSKNAVIIDKLSGLMYTRLNQVGAGGTQEAMIDAALAASITVDGVTYDDWFMADRSEYEQALGGGYLTDPNTGVDLFFQSNATQWTAATRIASSGNAYYFDLGNFTINTLAKTTPSQRTILVRKAHNLITAP